MDNLLIYIVKANIMLLLVWLMYRCLLRNVSFHQWKRGYLLLGLVLSIVAPLFTWTSIETTYVQIANTTHNLYTTTITPTPETTWTTKEVFLLLAFSIYAIGVLFFAIRLLRQYLTLRNITKSAMLLDAKQHIYQHHGVNIAFSFGKRIYINPKQINPNDLESIIKHEQKHVTERHGVDLWMIQIYRTLFWYNPILRCYQQDILQNHEWIVDEYMTQQVHSQHYQMQLLKYQSLAPQTHLANSFAISNLKKRILFMNQKPSSKWKLSLFATSFLALAGVTAAMAFDKKENIVYLETEPIVDVAPENGTELPTIIEQNAERPKSTATNTTKDNKDVVAGNPLIIVDGKVYERDLSTIKPEHIASMDILKGENAITKYGNAGSNGVIEITTGQEAKATAKRNASSIDNYNKNVVARQNISFDSVEVQNPVNGSKEYVVVETIAPEQLTIQSYSVSDARLEFDSKNAKISIDGKERNILMQSIDQAHIEAVNIKKGTNNKKDEIDITIRKEYKQLYNK